MIKIAFYFKIYTIIRSEYELKTHFDEPEGSLIMLLETSLL